MNILFLYFWLVMSRLESVSGIRKLLFEYFNLEKNIFWRRTCVFEKRYNTFLKIVIHYRGVVWCLIKGNESHGTVNPMKEETTQNIFLPLIDILLVQFIQFSGVFSNGHFSIHAISKSHLHSTIWKLRLVVRQNVVDRLTEKIF
jgi:hypothetical protein